MSVARAQIMKAKELARELYIHTGRVTTQVCWDDALRFVLTLDELVAAELASTTENPATAGNANQGHRPAAASGAGRFLVEREGVDGTEYFAQDAPGYWTSNWRHGDLMGFDEAVDVVAYKYGATIRPLSEVEAENAGCGL